MRLKRYRVYCTTIYQSTMNATIHPAETGAVYWSPRIYTKTSQSAIDSSKGITVSEYVTNSVTPIPISPMLFVKEKTNTAPSISTAKATINATIKLLSVSDVIKDYVYSQR